MPRRLRLAAPFIVLALTVAACGGSKVAVQEVPGGAVNLTASGGAALNPAATATPTPAAGATATPTATTTGAASTSSSTTTQQSASTGTGSTGGGTEAPSTTTTTTGAATATPAPGSPTQQYEDFCAQNPGAC
jgi:hypothetical protein